MRLTVTIHFHHDDGGEQSPHVIDVTPIRRTECESSSKSPRPAALPSKPWATTSERASVGCRSRHARPCLRLSASPTTRWRDALRHAGATGRGGCSACAGPVHLHRTSVALGARYPSSTTTSLPCARSSTKSYVQVGSPSPATFGD